MYQEHPQQRQSSPWAALEARSWMRTSPCHKGGALLQSRVAAKIRLTTLRTFGKELSPWKQMSGNGGRRSRLAKW